MLLKTDPFLQQLKGLEDYLAQNRITDARNAIEGIRMMLLRTNPDEQEETAKVTTPDPIWLRQTLEQIRKKEPTVASGHSPIMNFTDDIVCWGWYDAQTDSTGRSYRWCGNETEAGLTLPYDIHKHAALVISIRPLEPSKFDQNSVELRVNGIPTALQILQGKGTKTVDILIVPEQLKANASLDLSFYIKYSCAPCDLSKNTTDTRKLTFNAVEFTWLPKQLL